MIQPDTEARNGMKSRGHLALSSFLGLGLALALGSCSSMPVEREQDVTARALLDHTTGEIVLPLDEYDPFDSDSVGLLVDRAFDISTAKCMSRRGLQYTAAAVEEDPSTGPVIERTDCGTRTELAHTATATPLPRRRCEESRRAGRRTRLGVGGR